MKNRSLLTKDLNFPIMATYSASATAYILYSIRLTNCLINSIVFHRRTTRRDVRKFETLKAQSHLNNM